MPTLDFHREGTSAFKWELHCSHSSNESDVATKTLGAGFSPKICLPWLRSLGRWPGKPSLFHPPSRMNDQIAQSLKNLSCRFRRTGSSSFTYRPRVMFSLAQAMPRLASPPYRFLVTSGSCERPVGQEEKAHRYTTSRSTAQDDESQLISATGYFGNFDMPSFVWWSR